MYRSALAAVLAVFASVSVSLAQDTRTADLERKRAEKAAAVEPYRPGKLEKALLYMEEEDPLRKIAPYNGPFLTWGYTWKPVGSGVGLGGGFRHDLFGRRARIVLGAGVTMRLYHAEVADFSLPYLANDRVELGVQFINRHQPQDDYWGLGSASVRDDRVSFLLDQKELQGRAIVTPVKGLNLGTRFGRIAPSIGEGTDGRFPSIEEVFDDATAPGLAAQPDFNFWEVFAQYDHRDQPNNARSGGFYFVNWRNNADQDLDRYSHQRLDLDVQHFFPIFDKKRVVAIRGRLTATAADFDAGDEVPFYMQPTMGGSESLRSVRDFRFRDRSMMAFNFEYRWEAFAGMDMALFTDRGKVAPRGSKLSFGSMKQAYGVGFRFNTYKSVFLRVDLGTGAGEGLSYYVKFSKAF